MGAFTAASNITGICLDVDGITALLHRYGALAFWDYATAAPYIKVDMNPTEREGGREGGMEGAVGSVTAAGIRTPTTIGRMMEVGGEGELSSSSWGSTHAEGRSRIPSSSSSSSSSLFSQPPNFKKDAVFFSGHKFVGGPGTSLPPSLPPFPLPSTFSHQPSLPPSLPSTGTPGVLVVKKALLRNEVPERPGGGTVFFVKDHSHRYLSNQVEREEGGTPDILGSIRLGLCFQLKDRVGAEYAKEREALFAKKTLESFCSNPNIVVLGDFKTPRLPIFSFLIRHGPSYLHYNFVCALLNDLFGIQVRLCPPSLLPSLPHSSKTLRNNLNFFFLPVPPSLPASPFSPAVAASAPVPTANVCWASSPPPATPTRVPCSNSWRSFDRASLA